MGLILECPKTAKIDVMLVELNLPSVVNRICEITYRTVSCLLRTDAAPFKQALVTLHDDSSRAPVTPYLRKVYVILAEMGVLEAFLGLVFSPTLPVWPPSRVSVDIEALRFPCLASSCSPGSVHAQTVPVPLCTGCSRVLFRLS